MLWELVATVFAGLGAAGIALTLRLMSAQRLPRWAIPASAGIAMLSFQLYSEYSWLEHQRGLLPETVVVVKTIEESAPWKPWTLAFPQTVRFMAVETNTAAANTLNKDVVLAQLYFFERRLSARRVPQVIHCTQRARANFSDELYIPGPGEALNHQWVSIANEEQLLKAVCRQT